MENSSWRKVSRAEVENPERLTKALWEMQSMIEKLYARNQELERRQAEHMEITNQRLQGNSTLITGARTTAEALVRLGVDQSATKLSNYAADVAPSTTDDQTKGYDTGSEIITKTGDVYRCVNPDPGNAQWKKLSP